MTPTNRQSRHTSLHWSTRLAVASVGLAALIGHMGAADKPSALAATATLTPAEGSLAYGSVVFLEEEGGVRVIAHVSGLTPGPHGFHVHENGDISAPDLSSAGGHFNPGNTPHAGRDAAKRHMGDLGNLVADANGFAQLDYVDPHLKLSGPASIVGRAVIVHAGADDGTSQPSGNAGPRVAGGVIVLKE